MVIRKTFSRATKKSQNVTDRIFPAHGIINPSGMVGGVKKQRRCEKAWNQRRIKTNQNLAKRKVVRLCETIAVIARKVPGLAKTFIAA